MPKIENCFVIRKAVRHLSMLMGVRQVHFHSAECTDCKHFLPAQLCVHCTAHRHPAHAQFSAMRAVMSEIEMTEMSILPAAEKCGKGSGRTKD